MISAILVGILVLVRTPVTCTKSSENHKLPVHNTSSCIRHQTLRSCIPAFGHFGLTSNRMANRSSRNDKNNFLENAVKFHEKEFNNCSSNCTNAKSGPENVECKTLYNISASRRNQPIQPRSSLIPNTKPQLNVMMSNHIARKSKCRDIQLLNSACCDRTMTAQTVYDHVTHNGTKSICQPIEKCSGCTKAKSETAKKNKIHKRRYKREAFGVDGKSGLPDDTFPVVSDNFPIFQNPKNFDRWQEDGQKYMLYTPLGDNDRIVTNKMSHSTESVQLTDVNFDQMLDLLRYHTFKVSDGKSININMLCEQLRRSSVPYLDTIKTMLRCEVSEPFPQIKQDADDVTTVRDGIARPCRYPPVSGHALKTPESSSNPDIDSNDLLSTPCIRYPEKTAPLQKTVTKKSQDPFSENSDTQSLVFTQFDSCSHHIETKLLTLPGCVPKSVLITRCHGNCQSSSVPDWDADAQDIRQVEHCTCCSANEIKSRTLRFHCPRRPEGVVLITMGFPFRCSCRPCATVPEITADQPYDY